MTVDQHLNEYLGSIGERPWQPGVLDCGIFIADWVKILTGIDPIADVRGTYSSEEEFDRILDREGGFLKSCSKRIRRVGFVRTMTAEVGYPAVVMAPFRFNGLEVDRRPTGAICVTTNLRAVITSDMGVVIAGNDRLPLVRAFRRA
jgi:hypothetical protein